MVIPDNQFQTTKGYGIHKNGCQVKGKHKVPIDCMTWDDMVRYTEQLKDEMETYRIAVMQLKSRVFDLEHDDD